MRCKWFHHALGAVALTIAAGTTFKVVTGDCPLACLFRHLHGQPAPAVSN